MKKLFIFFLSFFVLKFCYAQNDSAALVKEIVRFEENLNKEYEDPATSPLSKKEREGFKQVNFFPINLKYVVTAKFVRTPDEKIFGMPTSGKIKKSYVKYGAVQFPLMGKEYKLNVYQSIDLLKERKYRNYLFIPFRDATSGKETYGGGRYIDLTIPRADTITINFNLAYHPYCAYTEGYNCPIPPRENYLPVKVEAGVRF
ncbi:MAG TPA: DUF1684 domain-containing protein [Chitinophagaceae bacterium]|jgi:hypothetical protein